MLKHHVLKGSTAIEEYTDEDCFITELYKSDGQIPHSIAKARVLPGVTTRLHKLSDTQEEYYILHGTGEISIDGHVIGFVQQGDLVIIPPDVSQQIRNTGNEDLTFLCICTPAFDEKNYHAIGG